MSKHKVEMHSTREEKAMAKRLRDSRKVEAAYESTLDPRQRATATPDVAMEWESRFWSPAPQGK